MVQSGGDFFVMNGGPFVEPSSWPITCAIATSTATVGGGVAVEPEPAGVGAGFATREALTTSMVSAAPSTILQKNARPFFETPMAALEERKAATPISRTSSLGAPSNPVIRRLA